MSQTPEEKAAAKAAKVAEKEAAKAAKAAEAIKAAEASASISVIAGNAWKSIRSQHVFVKDPMTKKAQDTGNIFAAQPRVPYTVFPLADNPDETLYCGGINGLFFAVVVGVEVELPRDMAAHISKSRLANNRVARSLRVVNPFTGQPVEVNLDSASEETRKRLGLS